MISFIQKIENLDFAEAAEFIAKKINYNLQFNYSGTPEVTKKRSRIILLNDLAKKYYNYIFFNSKFAASAQKYLKDRGFNEETLNFFEIGFSLDNWDNFSDFAIKRGFKASEIIESGLGIQSSRGTDGVYDRFRARIMFPIKDLVGKTVGFGGRILSKQNKTVSVAQASKYINTPETKIYSKSKNIFGLADAKNNIVEKDQVFIVEGYTDVMALYQNEIKNVVASLGTALTKEQIEIICRFTKNIILVFDSDSAGVNASLKGMERLRDYNENLDLFNENNVDIRVALLEEGYDPADFVFKKGPDAFISMAASSLSIIDFTINMILKKYDLNNLSHKLRATDELLGFITTLSSRIVQEECIKKVAERLKLNESHLVEQFSKKISLNNKKVKVSDIAGSQSTEEQSMPSRTIEKEALKILIHGAGSKFFDLLNIGIDHFRFDDTKKLYEIIKDEFEKIKNAGKSLNFPLEISSNMLEGEHLKKLYNDIAYNPVNYSDYDLASEEVFNNLRKLYLDDRIDEVKSTAKKS